MNKREKKPKNKRTSVITVMALIFALIVVLNFFLKAFSNTSSFKYEIAQQETLYKSITASCVIIKEEQYLIDNTQGYIVPQATDGEKVSGGQTYATIFSTSEQASAFEKAMNLDKEITYYTSMAQSAGALAANTDSLNTLIQSDIKTLTDSIYRNELEDIQSDTKSLRTDISMKQTQLGETVNCAQKIAELQAQRDALGTLNGKELNIPEKTGGYFVSNPDGYEYLSDIYSECTSYNTSKIDELLASEPQELPTGVRGKLITSMTCYLLCNVDTASTAEMTQYTYDPYTGKNMPSTYDIYFPFSTAGTVSATVVEMTPDANGRTALVFRITTMNTGVANLRLDTCQIRILECENCFKIHQSAIHKSSEPVAVVKSKSRDEEGVSYPDGVTPADSEAQIEWRDYYWIWVASGTSETPKQKRVNIEFYDGNYVIVSNENNSKNYIRALEKVIYDGTVGENYEKLLEENESEKLVAAESERDELNSEFDAKRNSSSG